MSVFAVLLYVADRSPQQRRVENLGFWPAFWIGTSQILALMPGVSRSGITITTGRFLRLDRDAAARFAFLLLIPIVFGAVVYKGLKNVVLNPLPAGSVGPFVVGTMAADGGRPDRDRPAARLRAPARLHGLRDLPPGARGADRDRDRQRLAQRALLDDSETKACRKARGRPEPGRAPVFGEAQPTERSSTCAFPEDASCSPRCRSSS